MNTFWAALQKELLEQWRSYRLLVVLLVLGLFGLASPLLAKMTPELLSLIPEADAFAPFIPAPTLRDAYLQYHSNISQFGVILALLLTMGAVVQEKEKKTAALVLTKPLSRLAFLAAKFVALALTFLTGIAVAALAGYYYTLLLFEAPPFTEWLAFNGLMLLFLLVHIALALFFSTLARSTVASAGMAFGAMLVLAILASLPRLGEYAPASIINWGLLQMTGPGVSAWPAFFISLALIAAALLGAWLVFERQEI
jgi:ABC-2 type transport system permease protein